MRPSVFRYVVLGAVSLISCRGSQQPGPVAEIPRATALPRLGDFLSSHSSAEKAVKIDTVPDPVYLEEGRNSYGLSFDFIISGQTDRQLILHFVKVAVYDSHDRLLTYRHVNHNGMNPSIRTLGRWKIQGKETIDLYNPFHSFASSLDVKYLRYMFTFRDAKTKDELYYGDVVVRPVRYVQKARLQLPMKGLLTVLDGHDYYSHHRRFSTVELKRATQGQIVRNFGRYSIDLVQIGANGHLRKMRSVGSKPTHDFHVPDAKDFHGHAADIFAPADGTVADVVNNLPDLYNEPFNLPEAIKNRRLKDLAGNLVVIKHNDGEYSHLFHLLRGSIKVERGQRVKRGQLLGKLGFSGAATTYVHLHYQLMDGPDPLSCRPLPVKFSDVVLVEGGRRTKLDQVTLDTGDFVLN